MYRPKSCNIIYLNYRNENLSFLVRKKIDSIHILLVWMTVWKWMLFKGCKTIGVKPVHFIVFFAGSREWIDYFFSRTWISSSRRIAAGRKQYVPHSRRQLCLSSYMSFLSAKPQQSSAKKVLATLMHKQSHSSLSAIQWHRIRLANKKQSTSGIQENKWRGRQHTTTALVLGVFHSTRNYFSIESSSLQSEKDKENCFLKICLSTLLAICYSLAFYARFEILSYSKEETVSGNSLSSYNSAET